MPDTPAGLHPEDAVVLTNALRRFPYSARLDFPLGGEPFATAQDIVDALARLGELVDQATRRAHEDAGTLGALQRDVAAMRRLLTA